MDDGPKFSYRASKARNCQEWELLEKPRLAFEDGKQGFAQNASSAKLEILSRPVHITSKPQPTAEQVLAPFGLA